MKVKLKGNVTIYLGEKKVVNKKNNVSVDFARSLAQLVLLGAGATGAYSALFGLPSNIALVLLNNGAIVNTLQMQSLKFNDVNITCGEQIIAQTVPARINDPLNTPPTIYIYGEQTCVQFFFSDATPACYTFTCLKLYTVVNSQLYLEVACVTLSQPLTKTRENILAVTWKEEIVTCAPLASQLQSVTSYCGGDSTCINNAKSLPGMGNASVFNFIWLLLIYPNIRSLTLNTAYPLYNLISKYVKIYDQVGTPPLPQGVICVYFLGDQLNVVSKLPVTQYQAEVQVTSGSVTVELILTGAPTTAYPFILPLVCFCVNANKIIVAMGILLLENSSDAGSGAVSIIVTVPYSSPTLQQLTVNTP